MNTTQRIISDNYAKWGKVIAAAGIEPEVGHLSHDAVLAPRHARTGEAP